MKSSNSIAYLTVDEDLNKPLLRRQVIELLCEIRRQQPQLKITLYSFLAIHTIINHRKDIRQVRNLLLPFGIKLRTIPSLVPWPVPHLKLRKLDVGYRPQHIWDERAAKLLRLIVWPIMVLGYISGVRIYHCRSYPAAFAAISLKNIISNIKVVFDPRSDYPEENVTAGNWEMNDDNYLFWKRSERYMLEKSDAIACIAPSYERAYKTIAPHANYFQVPNNVDCMKFQRNSEHRLNIRQKMGIRGNELVLCYLGDITSKGWHRIEVYAKACKLLMRSKIDLRFMFIVPPRSAALLRNSLQREISSGLAIIVNAPFDSVPAYLGAADYGVMFLHKSKIAVGTKIGEYLAAGLPVIANRNCIGAVDLIEQMKVGLILDIGAGDLDTEENIDALQSIKLGRDLQQWSVEVARFAQGYFDNTKIAAKYIQHYYEC